MNIVIWVAQVALGGVFLLAGSTKVFTPLPELAMQVPWVGDVPAWVPRLAGVSELFGAVGVVLPTLVRVQPRLAPLAAAGLGLVMALAAGFHLTRNEFGAIAVNLALMALAAFVFHGRRRLHPISPR